MSDRHVPASRWLVIVVLALIGVGLILSGITLMVSSSGAASSEDVQAQGQRRDCVTTIQSARRSVFDNVDIYKAIQIEQLSSALLNAQQGIKPTDEEIAAFSQNDVKLRSALVEARALQPAKVLDNLIAHGGYVSGVYYKPCPE